MGIHRGIGGSRVCNSWSMRGGSRTRCSEGAVSVSHDEIRVESQGCIYKDLDTYIQKVSNTKTHLTGVHHTYNSVSDQYSLPYPQRHISQ